MGAESRSPQTRQVPSGRTSLVGCGIRESFLIRTISLGTSPIQRPSVRIRKDSRMPHPTNDVPFLFVLYPLEPHQSSGHQFPDPARLCASCPKATKGGFTEIGRASCRERV